MREANNEKPPPKPIQLKIHKNWKELVSRRIYILSWIRNYDQNTAVSDLIAGVTLGLTLIPQALSYAALAHLPAHYGLYAAFMGKFVGIKQFFANKIYKIVFCFFLSIRCLHLRILRYHKRSFNWTYQFDGPSNS